MIIRENCISKITLKIHMPSIPRLPPRDSLPAVLDRYSHAFTFNLSCTSWQEKHDLVLFSTGSSPTQVTTQKSLGRVSTSGSPDLCLPFTGNTSESSQHRISGQGQVGEEQSLLEKRKHRRTWFLHLMWQITYTCW